MKRVIIVCEGQTEQQFCNELLRNHLQQRNIYIDTPLIKSSGGGIVPWDTLKRDFERHLSDKNVWVTCLIDFYGIKKSYLFPYWEQAQANSNKIEAVAKMENGMQEALSEDMRRRFWPYIQLHEFEALLFSDIEKLNQIFEPSEIKNFILLKNALRAESNPELINNGEATAPSKRIQNALSTPYSKTLHGIEWAKEIGLEMIREKCKRFDGWVTMMEHWGN